MQSYNTASISPILLQKHSIDYLNNKNFFKKYFVKCLKQKSCTNTEIIDVICDDNTILKFNKIWVEYVFFVHFSSSLPGFTFFAAFTHKKINDYQRLTKNHVCFNTVLHVEEYPQLWNVFVKLNALWHDCQVADYNYYIKPKNANSKVYS